MKRLSAILILFFMSPFAYGEENLRENAVVKAVRRASPAVVNISTETTVRTRPKHPFAGDPFFGDFFGRIFEPRVEKRQSLGSGVIMDPKGYILTNEHLVVAAEKIFVLLANGDEYEAVVIGTDTDLDLAVLKIETDKLLPSIPLGRSDDLMIGEDIIAIGNPFGLSHSVTRGVISAVNRFIRVDGRTYEGFVQIDAAINPGNSGGPLLNINGDLIGINTAIYGGAEGIGFAIPVDEANRVIDDLIHQGFVEPVWLGMAVSDLTDDIRSYLAYKGSSGVVITTVYGDSPASRIGIAKGDILLAINNAEVSSRSGFIRAINRLKAGDSLSLHIFKNGETFKKNTAVAAFPTEISQKIALDKFGFKVSDDKSLVRQYSRNLSEGVVITNIQAGSSAYRKRMAQGDIIRAINNYKITDAKSFYRAVARTMWQRSILLEVMRGGTTYRLTLEAD